MLINDMHKQGLINLNGVEFILDNTMYLTMVGSQAYQVSDENSDFDVYGFCIPPKTVVFPHLAGEILGFGTQKQRFNQWQQQDVTFNLRQYDLTVYNIVHYFQLVMENNPNMVDSLFTPTNCVLQRTAVGEHVRNHRRLFLSKKVWHTFKGYAYSQMNRVFNRKYTGKRLDLVEKFGFDVKAAYHVVRLMLEVEQILSTGDLDLTIHREQLKAIRRGEWSAERIKDFFTTKERTLEELYINSKLPWSPDEDAIQNLLLECLEMHYGNLNGVVHLPDRDRQALEQIYNLASKALGNN